MKIRQIINSISHTDDTDLDKMFRARNRKTGFTQIDDWTDQFIPQENKKDEILKLKCEKKKEEEEE